MWYLRFGKRILDIIIGLLSLLILSPLLIVTAVLIKIFDPGPVIFSQIRVGRYGEDFQFYKFRSMPVGTRNLPSDQLSSVNLTWVGKVIRRTNIDELPQLFNILKGDMSIVGPRPPLPSQVELIQKRRSSGLLNCRPGLTGLAQVNSYDGMSIDEKVNYDAKYVEMVSFLYDALIIIKTINYLFRRPPVY